MRGGAVHPAWPPPLCQALFFRKLCLSSCTVLSHEAFHGSSMYVSLEEYGSLALNLWHSPATSDV